MNKSFKEWLLEAAKPNGEEFASKERTKEFGVRWTEFDRHDYLITKEKIFNSAEARDRFITKLEKKDNFNQVVAMTAEATLASEAGVPDTVKLEKGTRFWGALSDIKEKRRQLRQSKKQKQ